MSFNELIEETKAALKEDPTATRVSFETASDLVGVTEVEVAIGDRTVRVDEPEGLGGTDTAPNPVEYALASLGSCQAITYRVWADRLGIPVDRISVRVDGDLDLQGFFGLDPAVRPGFEGVRVEVEVEGPESQERYQALFDAVNQHCPVLDLFENRVPVKARLAPRSGTTASPSPAAG